MTNAPRRLTRLVRGQGRGGFASSGVAVLLALAGAPAALCDDFSRPVRIVGAAAFLTAAAMITIDFLRWRRSANRLTFRRDQVGDFSLFVREGTTPAGTPPATPVVLVHGFVISSSYMVPLSGALRKVGLPNLAPDLPGYGRSSRGVPTAIPSSITEMATHLREWMQAVGIERAVVLGNSMGAQVALALAADHPECVAGLVLVGLTTEPSRRHPAPMTARLGLAAFYEAAAIVMLQAIDWARCGPRRITHTLRFALADTPEARFAKVTVPTLVVRGADDVLASAEWTERVAREIRGSTLITFPDAGHAVNYSEPEELARVVKEWMAGIA